MIDRANRWRSVALLLGLLPLAACGQPDRAPGARGRAAAKGDGPASCAGVCGDQAPGGCWCDALCASYGDCCADKAPLCDAAPPADALEFYRGWEAQRAQVVAAAEASLGQPFEQIDEVAYRAWLPTLDLATDDGLMTWSQVTGIIVLAVSGDSNLFYFNGHLLAAGAGAALSFTELSALTSTYDPLSGQVTITDAAGQPRETIPLAPGVIRKLARTRGVSHNAGFAADAVSFATLAPYLALPSGVANRQTIADALAALPLTFVKVLRGKGLFLSTQWGRSYAASSPLSNEVYDYFAGFAPGAFFERNSPTQTPRTLIHELCHIVDHTVIRNSYGGWYYPHQFPAFAALAAAKERIFGAGDSQDLPWDGTHGYVSSYARSNAQENFAEHCMAYVWERAAFSERAAAEALAGHAMLADKLAFMEQAFGATDAALVRLSPQYVEEHLASDDGDGGGGGPAASCAPGQTQQECCLAALYDVAALESRLGAALGVGVACAVGEPQDVALDGGADHYYAAQLVCTPAAAPAQELLDGLAAAMAAQGYHGISTSDEGGQIAIHAWSSTRRCSSYL